MEKDNFKIDHSNFPGSGGGLEERIINRAPRSWKDWLILISWVVVIVAIGVFAVNQTLEYYYKAQFLKAPCKLCLELNPEVSKQCFIKYDKLYPNGYGGWEFENGTPYETPAGSIPSSIDFTPYLNQS